MIKMLRAWFGVLELHIFGQALGEIFGAGRDDHTATSPQQLWRDDYDRRAREGEAKYYSINRPSWMVAGAKAAGIHPNLLFPGGPGMRGGNTPPIRGGGGGSYGGQDPTARERMLGALQAEKLRAETSYVEELTRASKYGKMTQAQPASDQNPPDIEQPPVSSKSKIIRGAYGAAYKIPKGVSPGDAWQAIGGEAADYVQGFPLLWRMYNERNQRIEQQRMSYSAAMRDLARQRWARAKKKRAKKYRSRDRAYDQLY